jgi:hypothetical protein
MTTLTPSKAAGATAKASGVLYVEPATTITDAILFEQIALDGVNVAFAADYLSACLTHERCGVHLYRAAFEVSNNPAFKARYAQFGEETLRHVALLEEVVSGSEGNPNYVSPLARATQASDAKILEATYMGTGTPDLAVLERAVNEVLAEEEEHLAWAQQTRARLTILQAQLSTAEAGMKIQDLAETVKAWFSDDLPSNETANSDLTVAQPGKRSTQLRRHPDLRRNLQRDGKVAKESAAKRIRCRQR